MLKRFLNHGCMHQRPRIHHLAVFHQNSIPAPEAHYLSSPIHPERSWQYIPDSQSPDPSLSDHQIRGSISDCGTAEEKMSIIDDHGNTVPFEAEKVGNAMESTESTKIMDALLTKSGAKPSIEDFHVLLDELSQSGEYELCSKYFNIMMDEYRIAPTLSIICALIKSCRKRAVFDEAQRYWDLMEEHGLKADERAYHELMIVYLRSGRKHAVIALFNEYLSRLKRSELSMSPILFTLHLRVHCQFGDIKGMLSALELMTSFGINVAADSNISLYLMKGYLTAKQFTKCITTFDKMASSGLSVHSSHLLLRGDAVLNIMRDRVYDFGGKQALYKELNDLFYVEFREHGMWRNPNASRLLLSAAIVCFHNLNPMKMVKVFERLLADQRIQYKNRCAFTGKMRLDLHGFDRNSAQFLLRYVIAFELSDRLKCAEWMDGGDVLDGYFVIVSGKGLHSMGRPDHKGHLREFVMEELLRFDPPIQCEIDQENTGQLKVHRSQLIQYMKCGANINYAMHRLAVPSEDWFISHGEDRKKVRKPNVEQFCYRWNESQKSQRRNRGITSRHTMKEMTSVLGEGQHIEVYDERNDQWHRLTLKQKVSGDQFIVFDPIRQQHQLMDLRNSVQLQ